MIYHTSSFQRGFTLIELLVSMLIMAILAGVGFISIRTFSQRQQVVQSVKNLQQELRFAQKKARVGEKPTGCVTLNGYIIQGTTSSRTISVIADCVNQDYTVTTINLNDPTRLSQNLNMTFRVLQGGVVNAGNITLSNGAYSYRFTVNAGGDISEGNFL